MDRLREYFGDYDEDRTDLLGYELMQWIERHRDTSPAKLWAAVSGVLFTFGGIAKDEDKPQGKLAADLHRLIDRFALAHPGTRKADIEAALFLAMGFCAATEDNNRPATSGTARGKTP